MNEDFHCFMESFLNSVESIDVHYFKTNVYGSEQSISRERIYCYELYHQMRKQLGDDFPFRLDGELDKQNHPEIHDIIGPKKPDFVVHVLGDMSKNLVIVEVKRLVAEIGEIKEDIVTLQEFLDNAAYFRAILLIFGDGYSRKFGRIKQEWTDTSDNRIILVWHNQVGHKPNFWKLG